MEGALAIRFSEGLSWRYDAYLLVADSILQLGLSLCRAVLWRAIKVLDIDLLSFPFSLSFHWGYLPALILIDPNVLVHFLPLIPRSPHPLHWGALGGAPTIKGWFSPCITSLDP